MARPGSRVPVWQTEMPGLIGAPCQTNRNPRPTEAKHSLAAHATHEMRTFFWYDYETFTTKKPYRIAQFAGIRTDENLQPVEDPVNMYCRPTMDYLPDPDACLRDGPGSSDSVIHK